MIGWINLIMSILLWGSLIFVCVVSRKKDNISLFLVNYTSCGYRRRMSVYVRESNQRTAALMLRNWLKSNHYYDVEIVFVSTSDTIDILDEHRLDDD